MATLEVLARLLGYTTPARFPSLRPDVLLARNASLFVGEAKATESPGSIATCERVSRYLRHLNRCRQRGDVLVLCVGGHPEEWANMIAALTSHVSTHTWGVDLRALAPDEWLVATKRELAWHPVVKIP